MINSKITKPAAQQNTEEKLIKLLESMDWKLWEIYNMMKDYTSKKDSPKYPKDDGPLSKNQVDQIKKTAPKPTTKKAKENT